MEIYIIIGLIIIAIFIKTNKLLLKPFVVITSSLFLVLVQLLFVNSYVLIVSIFSIFIYTIFYIFKSRKLAIKFLYVMTIFCLCLNICVTKYELYSNASYYISADTVDKIIPLEVQQAALNYLSILGITRDDYINYLDNVASNLQPYINNLTFMELVELNFDAKEKAEKSNAYYLEHGSSIITSLEAEKAYYESLSSENKVIYEAALKEEVNNALSF